MGIQAEWILEGQTSTLVSEITKRQINLPAEIDLKHPLK